MTKTENIHETDGGSVTEALPKGFTYFVRDGDMIKIGSSMNPENRIKAIQSGFPRKLEIMAIVPMETVDEFQTHQRFGHLRLNGEWFQADKDLLNFIRSLQGQPALPDGMGAPIGLTLSKLIDAYRTDEDSTYRTNRYHVRQNRDSMLRRIIVKHGHELLSGIKARVILAWHKDWTDGGKKLATGSSFIGQLRTLFSFGATLLEDPDCERLCGVLHKMRFAGAKPKDVSLTAEDVIAIRAKAHEFGWESIAMAQAFQWDCTFRQRDAVGEYVPISEPGMSDVTMDGMKWLRGIRWEEIDENLILRHVTSKKQKLTTVDLRLAEMVLAELQIYCEGQPVVTVDKATLAVTAHRDLLPASGPIILNEQTAYPWSANEFRRKWRILARACGIPDWKKNMGSRHGAIEEAIQAGAPIEFVRHAATHSDVSQTADYDRSQAESTAKVMKMRAESRRKAAM